MGRLHGECQAYEHLGSALATRLKRFYGQSEAQLAALVGHARRGFQPRTTVAIGTAKFYRSSSGYMQPLKGC